MLEQESFWENNNFAVVTDKTKPAMKLTIDELMRRGKRVYVADLSDNPDHGTKHRILDLPEGLDCAIIGLKKERTEAKQICAQLQIQCTIGKCPMMYLGSGLNIHTMHASLAKLLGKY